MSDSDKPLNSFEEKYRSTLDLLKVMRQTIFNADEQESSNSTNEKCSGIPIKIPDVVWNIIESRIPDVPENKRGRPGVSKRTVAEAVLTTVYLQTTPDLFKGNAVISASTVWKYRRLWEKKNIFKKLKTVRLTITHNDGEINWRWLKEIDLFLR